MKALFEKRTEPFKYHQCYLWLQMRWTEKMRKLTAGLSKKQLIYLLIIFTGMSSAILIYNLCRTLDKDGVAAKDNLNPSKIKTINLKK